jgi:IclR family transcriptional regulator, acetate operon repressor
MLVKQVEKALSLLELFAKEKSPLTLTALSDRLDMPKSSAFNLIDTLLVRGFIYETRNRGGYYPTRRLLDLSRDIVEGDPFLQRIHGDLEELARKTGETVLLSVRRDGDVVYLDVVESTSHIRYFAKIGERRPVYATSSGKAILTTYEPAERRAILESLTYVPHQKTTRRNAAELGAELEASIRRGWCEDGAEYTPDVMGIGVPLINGERRFGLALAGPIYRVLDRRDELAAALRTAAGRIQRLIENKGPDRRAS